MIVPFLLFFLLIGWSLYDGDLSPQESGVFVVVWLVLQAVTFLMKLSPASYIVSTVILDILLIVKIFGGDVEIR